MKTNTEQDFYFVADTSQNSYPVNLVFIIPRMFQDIQEIFIPHKAEKGIAVMEARESCKCYSSIMENPETFAG